MTYHRARTGAALLASVAVCAALLGGCDGSDSGNPPAAASNTAATAPPPDPVVQERPADEAALIALPDQAENEVTAAPNSCRANQLEDVWAVKWCSALKRVAGFTDWTGRVWNVEDGRVEIELGEGLYVYADFDKSSALFREVVANLKDRQGVALSGSFDQANLTCGEWADVGGGLGNAYEVHLTGVSPIEN